MKWTLILVGVVFAIFVLQIVYLTVVMVWGDQRTRGLAYYGLPPVERDRFKQTLRRHARLLSPILTLLGRSTKFRFQKAGFKHRGISGPNGTCNKQSFERADQYEAQPEDVFVVTQMKCGTTWMQHVVYQILCRGEGNLVEAGSTLYAVSPWLEAVKNVSMEDAPLIGEERPSRVVKTHLPVQLCPYSPEARYIYVARHPVSCFASCVDFIATNLGAFGPSLDQLEEWYCSRELMWWGTWTDHVKGWWRASQDKDNVLFVYFEDMKRDLPGIVRRVTKFLATAPLNDQELDRVVHKCGFQYMQEHKGAFEMFPPHILATNAELFVKGSADRHKDVPAETRKRISAWCVKEMEGDDFPLEQAYPDVTLSTQP